MLMIPRTTILIAALLTLLVQAGAQGQTAEATLPGDGPAAAQVEIAHIETTPRMIEFAGMTWGIKHNADGRAGPGPNYFSNAEQDVWVDDQGRLHLTISHRDGKWRCTEVVSEAHTGYGEYEFQVTGPVDKLDPNAVLGLFTWDTQTWKTDANSEIDIELTRWSDADAPILNYAVHPGWGPDTESGRHPERVKISHMKLTGDVSTHVIQWGPTRVICASYQGIGQDPKRLIDRWGFDDTNPPRIAGNGRGEVSDPIVIPKPSPTTNTRINLWLNNADRDKLGDPPTDGKPIEVIISGFRYTPAEQAQTQPDEAGG